MEQVVSQYQENDICALVTIAYRGIVVEVLSIAQGATLSLSNKKLLKSFVTLELPASLPSINVKGNLGQIIFSGDEKNPYILALHESTEINIAEFSLSISLELKTPHCIAQKASWISSFASTIAACTGVFGICLYILHSINLTPAKKPLVANEKLFDMPLIPKDLPKPKPKESEKQIKAQKRIEKSRKEARSIFAPKKVERDEAKEIEDALLALGFSNNTNKKSSELNLFSLNDKAAHNSNKSLSNNVAKAQVSQEGIELSAQMLKQGELSTKGLVKGNVFIGTQKVEQAQYQSLKSGDFLLSDALSKEEVMKVIEASLLKIRQCYNKTLLSTPDVEGTVVAKWEISSSGKTKKTIIEENTTKDQNVAECILAVINQMQFPKPRGGGNVDITFPFLLTQAGD